jgi:hypothetical protein
MATLARSAILGAGIGAGLMFLLDPARGRRRRALVRDTVVRAADKTRDAYEATRRDIGNRMTGAAAAVQARAHDEAADDRTIEARVRAALGHVSSYPRAVRATAENGLVTLSGDVLSSEVYAIESAVRTVRGVANVVNELRIHSTSAGIPARQGSRRSGSRSSWAGGAWSPMAMMMAGAGAAASFAAAVVLRRS